MAHVRTLFAFVAGAAAGAVLGFLLAPGEGEKVRQKITGKAQGIKEEVENEISEKADEVKSNIAGFLRKLEASLDALASNLEHKEHERTSQNPPQA